MSSYSISKQTLTMFSGLNSEAPPQTGKKIFGVPCWSYIMQLGKNHPSH